MRAFLASGREGNELDPVAEAAEYELAADEARAIWRRVQREGRDDAAARRRFHQEARAAAKATPPRPVVGRRTLVEAEAEARKAVPQTPGRYSLTGFEAREEPVAIHRKAESGVVDAKAADLVAAARMGGVPLDRALRVRLEAALGAELGAVRVHTDEAAGLAARALGARAFAIGEDLFFARGAYDSRSSAGQRLIAHEVAHVVQSRSATASRVEGLAISDPGDVHEHEADDFAERFVQSGPAAQLDRARASAVDALAGPAARRAPIAIAALGTAPLASGTAPPPLHSRPGPMLSRAPDPAPGPGAPKGPASKAAAMPTVQPSPAPPPAKQRTAVPPAAKPSAASPAPAPTPAPATRRPSTKPVPGPAPATPHPTPAAPGVTAPTTAAAAGAVASAAVTATGNFAAQIRAVAARHKQALTAKATTVKAEVAASIVAEKAKLIVGFVHTLAKMQADRDQARSEVHTHAETSRTHVRTAAKQEHTKLDQALVRQQQAARKTGDTLAASAVTQATQQGDRVHQGSQQRAAKARSVGDKWAGQFATLDGGGADAGSAVRAKAAELATKLLEGADEARQTCVDHGTKFAEDLRKDATDTAAGMPDKLADSRTHIDKNQSDALASIDDGVKNAHDGITQSFDQSRQQVLDKQSGATQVYDQLAQGIGQQLEQGSQQLIAKLDPAAEDIANHAEQAEHEGQKYAVSPDVTATIHTRIAGVVNDRLATLGSASSQAQGALDGAKTQGQQGAQQQTQSVIGQLDTVGTGMKASLTGKVTATTGKLDESASSAVTNIATIAPAADTEMTKVVREGQTKWTEQLTANVSKLSGGVDDALAHHDSQITKLDTDLGNQFRDAKSKQDKANEDQSWWSSAWDSVTSFMGDVFSFLHGMWDGFWEAAKELVLGIWDMLHTLWGILILVAVIILVVLVVIFFGWEALIIGGIILGLCFAAYYIYLAVTTPGLSPYERGKLFGKAAFNVVLGFAGVEFEWGELLNVAKWVPEAVELVRALGGLGRAIELVRAMGGIGKAVEFLRAVGGVEKLLELAEAAGGIAKLVELAKAAGGIAKLMELAEAVGGVQKLVELAKAAGGIEKLMELAKAAGGIEKLMELAKAVGGIDKLLELAKQAGGMAKLIEIITAAGGIEKLLEMAQEVGGMPKLLEMAKQAGGMTKLLEMAQQAGGMAKLLELARDAGGFDKLIALAKAAGGLDKLLALVQKAGSMAALAQIIKDVGGFDKLLTMIKEAGTFEDLLKLATECGGWPTLAKLATKTGGIKALETLLNDAKIGRNISLLEKLLDHPLIPDAATLTKLLKHAKVASGTELLELLAKVDTVERLLRMLDMANVPTGTKLLEWLTKAGGKLTAARLEDMLRLATAKGGSVQKMCDVAAGIASEFQKMADWADILKNVKPKPSYAPPPQVATYGFNGADTAHFLDHTWEFVDINARVNKSTTMWPHGTTPQQIADELGQALDRLNPPGTSPPLPIPNNALATGAVKVGSRVAGSGAEIGQFFPLAGDTIPARAMRAIKALIKP